MISRLKTLELHGYKTFASKINFEFPGKITAIVGPNGSGKSNIADAIRWVLGEQSFRLLRGRKTEDMIFAGSEGRSRAGMASSTITFNNEDGWLPIDFSEVSVTRRAYRDGQNEYLLNGQRIRLKDIQELFAQSGLAERTYTLIGQGLVDSALSIRPDERRKFFEEAAGIGLYRSRREDSLNRLDQTRHNLERVSDILSELEPRLRSLERQTRRFLEYKTLQADLQVLLRIWYGFHWNNAQQDLSQSKKVLQERELHLRSAKNNYEKIDNQLTEIRHQLTQKRNQLNELHTQSSQQHLELEKIIRVLAVLDERQRLLHDQEYNQNFDMVRLEEEIKSKESYLENLKDEFQKLSQEVQEAKTNLNDAQKVLNERFSLRGQIENELQGKRRLRVETETKIVEAKAKLNELNDRLSNLKISQEKLKQEASDLQVDVTEKENNLKSAQQLFSDSEKAIETLKKKIVDLEVKKKEIDKKLQEKRSIANKTQAEKIKLGAQYEALDQAEKTLSGFNQGAKNLMLAHKSGKISGNYKPLGEIFTVPKEFEIAIAAALGEYLDSIVLINESNPAFAIQYLANGDQGRAILLPLQWIKSVENFKLEKTPGNLGRASDLVNCDKQYSAILISLLGNTFVLDSTENALKIINQLPPQAKVVTISGEVFQGNGVIFAGKETRSAIIARPRQKQELLTMMNETQNQLSDLENDISKLDKEYLVITQNLNEIQIEERNLSQELQKKQKNTNEYNLAFEKIKQRMQWVDSQVITVEDQIIKSQNIIRMTTETVFEKEKLLDQQNKDINVLRDKLSALPIDEYQSSVGHWKTNVAVVERAMNEAQKRLSENQNNIEQNRQRYKAINRRIEDYKSALLEIDDEKAINKALESDLKAEIERIREFILPAEDELRILEKSFDKLQDDLSVSQQTVATAERYVTQGQLDYSRNKDVVENLRHRIEEDFGLVSFEYSSSISGPNPLPFDGLVEQLPIVTEIESNLEENINRQRAQMRRIGPINPEAEEEYHSVKERFEFLSTQIDDLKKADQDLRQVIAELDDLMQREFRKTFDAVAIEFKDLFTRLFGGGSAKLYLTDEENFNNTGIEIEARLPGRREQGLSLLSGGERSLTAVALIFALLRVSPTPFCVLDEVDAALDEANVGRFCELLNELSQKIQFIVITHNRNTVQAADVIYGITMGRDSSSQMISLRLDEVSDDLVK